MNEANAGDNAFSHDETALVSSPGFRPEHPGSGRVGRTRRTFLPGDAASFLFAFLVDQDGLALRADFPAALLHDEVVWRAVRLKLHSDLSSLTLSSLACFV